MSLTNTISAEELKQAGEQDDLRLIDVRTAVEYREVHARPAKNIPLDQLNADMVPASTNGSDDQPIYVICKGGKRGEMARQKLLKSGCENVINVEGGTEAWVAAGLPVVRGKKAISLERQVRIAAGFIVFAGAVAALATGNVYFAGIPAFVGAGLMFAGITDTCTMGMLIAKMPWNRR